MSAVVQAFRDLVRGLFAFPASPAAHRRDHAAVLEERYRAPRRCC